MVQLDGMRTRCLLALLVALLLEATCATECSFTQFKGASRARRWIIIYAIIAILVLVVLWWFSAANDKKYLRKKEQMEHIAATEDMMSAILKRMSLDSVHDFTFHGIQPKNKAATINVEFKDIRTEIPKRKTLLGGTQEKKVILAGVTGEFRPGRMAAIMGPSGAGKTTLLNVLSGKVRKGDWEVSGTVLVNGEEKDVEELKPVMGFVPQDDIVHELLTVRENIFFSAQLRCAAGTTKKQLNHITEDVLKVLQLEAQQNIKVGNRATGAGGLSGGQRKRVNIGLELAACPTLLFLDEPTSGLDSTTSLLLCSMLKKMTDLGMTIVMVIHQPRYGLFTIIDDVLLLGKGGKTSYVGPTCGAKSYFEGLGFHMPANENPADWMMDILSGQNLPVDNPRMPTKTLPGALFDAWQTTGSQSAQTIQLRRMATRGRLADDGDCFDVVRQNIEEYWCKFAPDGEPLKAKGVVKFLQECLGVEGDGIPDDIVDELMVQVTQDEKPDVITCQEFLEYLEQFRKSRANTGTWQSDSDESGSGSDDNSEGGNFVQQQHMERQQPGFGTHFQVVVHRSLIQWWRRMAIRMAFILVIEFAACFLGFFDAVIFHSPPWMPTVVLNVHVSLALLVSVYCLQCFGRDQAVYWREASHGLNRLAFAIGRTLVDSIDVIFTTFFFTATYYCIVLPELNFEIYFVPFLLVASVAASWGYLISCILPPILAPFVSAIICFMVGGILGLPAKMTVFLNGGIMEFIVDISCFTRWSVPMDFLAYDWCGDLRLDLYQNNTMVMTEYDLYKRGYDQGHWLLYNGSTAPWYTGVLALLTMAIIIRVLAYPALRFVNASKQR